VFGKRSQPGAPLRNRTVDLLLTMHTSVGSLPGAGSPGSSIRLAGCCCDLPRGTERCGYETRALPRVTGGVKGAGMFRSGPVREAGCRPATVR
jgi:hypothetical protein